MRLPEVSLITSWHIPSHREAREKRDLAALKQGLEQQIAQHDLYFLNHADIPCYARWLCEEPTGAGSPALACGEDQGSPLDFCAALRAEDVGIIAAALTAYLAENFKGRLVGPRPRFTALATYWPLISLPNSSPEADKLRQSSVKALTNSLLLASRLGCHHVEIVGGSALPENLHQSAQDAREAREERLQVLCQSLEEVYQELAPLLNGSRVPAVCLEIEPGEVYLVNNVQRFAELREALRRRGFPRLDHVLLNLDLAHMMLTEAEDGKTGSEVQLERAMRSDVLPWIGHMHMSDHARTHAADLCPGTYHFYFHYKPWLDLALKLCQQSETRFSGVIAVELEACGDIFEVVRAVGKTRRWVAHSAKQMSLGGREAARTVQGALLVVDIGNSTACLAERAPADIEECVREICQAVHRQRGSVFSFTGDGVVAFFDQEHFASEREAAKSALKALEELPAELGALFQKAATPEHTPYLRASLHWGGIHVPTGGPLRYQAIGREVVIACRLCGQAEKKARRAFVCLQPLFTCLAKVCRLVRACLSQRSAGRATHPFCHIAASKAWLETAAMTAPAESRDLELKGIGESVGAAFWELPPAP